MGATYNASVANLVDPLSNSPLNSPSHSNQHTEINDALQTLGVYTAYTPTWTNLTVGNGTQTFRFFQANKFVVVYGILVLGTTSSVSGAIRFTLPATATNTFYAGIVQMGDAGINLYPGVIESVSTTVAQVNVTRADGTYATAPATSGTVPFTWGNGDYLVINLTYEAA